MINFNTEEQKLRFTKMETKEKEKKRKEKNEIIFAGVNLKKIISKWACLEIINI